MAMGRKMNYEPTLRFYKNKLPYKEKTFNKIFQLNPYFEEMIGDKKEVWIADLGAGMFSTTGSTWPDVIVHLYPSDYLADEYGVMLKEKNIDVVIPVEKQNMEKLTYEDNFFDIVHCVNALDHCSKPLDALKEMYRVCKSGGWIYLRHTKNNAEDRNHSGLHQWNICKEGNDFCIFNDDSDDTVCGFKSEVVDNFIISKLKKNEI